MALDVVSPLVNELPVILNDEVPALFAFPTSTKIPSPPLAKVNALFEIMIGSSQPLVKLRVIAGLPVKAKLVTVTPLAEIVNLPL